MSLGLRIYDNIRRAVGNVLAAITWLALVCHVPPLNALLRVSRRSGSDVGIVAATGHTMLI